MIDFPRYGAFNRFRNDRWVLGDNDSKRLPG